MNVNIVDGGVIKLEKEKKFKMFEHRFDKEKIILKHGDILGKNWNVKNIKK